ncbi:MAG TPA: hypothetical protein VMO17_19255 [Terriglobia bacterium]|nr:hypothetical protein [Terriglobia bacterium]
MPCIQFREPSTNGLQLPLLFLDVDLDGVRHKVVRASAGGFRKAV